MTGACSSKVNKLNRHYVRFIFNTFWIRAISFHQMFCVPQDKVWLMLHRYSFELIWIFKRSEIEVWCFENLVNQSTSRLKAILFLLFIIISYTTFFRFSSDFLFSLDQYANCLVRSCFYQPRNIVKLGLFDYCSSLFTCLEKTFLGCLQVAKDAASKLSTKSSKRCHVAPILISLHCILVTF